jgi:hypothetical protein
MAAWIALPSIRQLASHRRTGSAQSHGAKGKSTTGWALSSAGIETPSDPLATAACCRRTARLLPIRSGHHSVSSIVLCQELSEDLVGSVVAHRARDPPPLRHPVSSWLGARPCTRDCSKSSRWRAALGLECARTLIHRAGARWPSRRDGRARRLAAEQVLDNREGSAAVLPDTLTVYKVRAAGRPAFEDIRDLDQGSRRRRSRLTGPRIRRTCARHGQTLAKRRSASGGAQKPRSSISLKCGWNATAPGDHAAQSSVLKRLNRRSHSSIRFELAPVGDTLYYQ